MKKDDKKSFWDKVVSDYELEQQIRKLALNPNVAVALKACQWVAEGKGLIAEIAGSRPEEIIFKGLGEDEQIQDMDD